VYSLFLLCDNLNPLVKLDWYAPQSPLNCRHAWMLEGW